MRKIREKKRVITTTKKNFLALKLSSNQKVKITAQDRKKIMISVKYFMQLNLSQSNQH